MSCEEGSPPVPASVTPAPAAVSSRSKRSARRGPLGWMLLLPVAAMLVFYVYVGVLFFRPHVSEAYRRTFLTGEFAIFPAADSWKPGDGLDYQVGTRLDFGRTDMRQWLARLDWRRVDTEAVTLRGAAGRVFLHLVGEDDPAARRHRLTLQLTCRQTARHAGPISVRVNGETVGGADCGDGALTIEADLPPGSLGVNRYETIEITRPEGGFFERIAMRLGLRADAVELMSLTVDGA